MTVRMRHTKSHTHNRRSHHALEAKTLGTCPHCGSSIRPHTVCTNCGKYQGRQVIDVFAKLDKKAKKKKQKELASQEASRDAEKPLTAEALSKK